MTDAAARYAYSDATPHKQDGLRLTVQKHASICAAIYAKHSWARQPYVFVDMNAGPGIDPDGNPGSPLVVADVLSSFLFQWRILAFERDAVTFSELVTACAGRPQVLTFNEDHADMLDRLSNALHPDKGYGMIYHDPSNAPGVNVELMRSAAARFPKVDLLINLACASYKRTVDHPGYVPIEDVLAGIGKNVWLIRRPAHKFQWSMFLGTNYNRYREYSDFARLDSQEGREILRTVSMTKREAAADVQPALL